MEVQEQRQGAVTVLRPTGPLTGVDAENFLPRFVEAMRESQGRLVLDASVIPLVDSKGLEALVSANDELAAIGQTLKLCGENETLRHVLELTELAPLFEHFDEVGAAVRSFL